MQINVTTKEELKESCLAHLRGVMIDMTTLQNDRALAFDAYLSKPYGNEVDGRSKFVTSDLSDVVESIMPSLMRTFYGNKNVVSIQPVGIEDEQKANLIEQKVNYDFMTLNNGYKILDTWFRDSLFQKMGVLKYYWLKEEQYKSREYEDLTEAEYLNLLQKVDAGDFIIDKEEQEAGEDAVFDEYGLQITPATVVYSVYGREVREISQPVVENVPPEEFIFDIKAKSLSACSFVAHKKRVHKAYLKKYKMDSEHVDGEIRSFSTDSLYLTRFADLGGIRFFQDDADSDFVYIYECYVDFYGKDGVKKPMKVVIAGNQVIECEENKYGKAPFCVISPLAVPHRMVGRDFADMVKPIQELHTYYIRYINDNLAFQNNGMRVINPFRLQMEDVLNENAPGAVWRTKYDIDPGRVVHNLTPTPLAPEVYGLIENMDLMRQERTGVTKYQSGMDSKSLNRTASGISQIMGAAQQRVELIARNYAEGGVKDLFQALVDMNIDFLDKEVNLKLNEEWQQITPDMIDGRFDITVDVGASMGSAEIQVNQMLQMLNTYSMAGQMGAPMPAKYTYNILREVWSRWGYKNVDLYAPVPEQVPQDMMQQMQAQMQLQAAMPQPQMPQQQGAMPTNELMA